MSTKLQTASCLDLVCVSYNADSLKSSARAKHGKGIWRCVVPAAAIPENWQNFLRMDSNMTQLFRFLSEAVFKLFDKKDKQLVITDGEVVLSKPTLPNLASPTSCYHKEADSRMMLHAVHTVQQGHHKIIIQTVDTNVVVLAVSVEQYFQAEDELWLAFGTGKHFQYMAAHELAAGLELQKARSLPMFHAQTWWDNVSSFAEDSKKYAWAIWTVLPEFTDTLLQL